MQNQLQKISRIRNRNYQQKLMIFSQDRHKYWFYCNVRLPFSLYATKISSFLVCKNIEQYGFEVFFQLKALKKLLILKRVATLDLKRAIFSTIASHSLNLSVLNAGSSLESSKKNRWAIMAFSCWKNCKGLRVRFQSQCISSLKRVGKYFAC